MADRLRELGFELDDAPLARAATPASRSAARTSPTPCSRTRPTPSACATRASTAATRCSRPTSSRARPPTSRARGPTVAEAIEVIHAAGGVAVWAHPFWDLDDPPRRCATLDAFADAGLDGVEGFYVDPHARSRPRLLHARGRERGLLTTGSADFHGPEHERFNTFRGVRAVRPGAEPRPYRAASVTVTVSPGSMCASWRMPRRSGR